MTYSSPLGSEQRKLELKSPYNHSTIRANLFEVSTQFNIVSRESLNQSGEIDSSSIRIKSHVF